MYNKYKAVLFSAVVSICNTLEQTNTVECQHNPCARKRYKLGKLLVMLHAYTGRRNLTSVLHISPIKEVFGITMRVELNHLWIEPFAWLGGMVYWLTVPCAHLPALDILHQLGLLVTVATELFQKLTITFSNQ